MPNRKKVEFHLDVLSLTVIEEEATRLGISRAEYMRQVAHRNVEKIEKRKRKEGMQPSLPFVD